MKLGSFEYLAPDSIAEVVSLLARYGDEAKLLAGGQSLVPLLAMRLASPAVVVDLNRVSELSYLSDSRDGLHIGALARHRMVEQLEDLPSRCAAISEAAGLIGHVAIRNRGTVVGSLAHADPAAEWPGLALALDAEVDACGPAGTRTIPAEKFFLGYLTTSLEADELATEVRVSIPQGRVGSCFLELARRHGDFAVAGVAALLSLTETEAIQRARIAVIGAAPTAVRVSKAEQVLLGQQPEPGAFAEAAEIVRRLIEPTNDVHGSAQYRRTVSAVLARRALTVAAERARGASSG